VLYAEIENTLKERDAAHVIIKMSSSAKIPKTKIAEYKNRDE
jgi:hypothetical protein